VRARLAALSECADDFVRALHEWRRRDAALRALPADEQWFVAQTLLGAWPLTPDGEADLPDRLTSYLQKALREAKLRTSWLDPDEAHERAVIDVARRACAPASSFRRAFDDLRARVELAGAANSLAQVVLKAVLPSAPDVYRGCEGWDLSLVDPDNRRPVAHDRLARQLEITDAHADWPALRVDWRDGAVKLAVTARVLRFRREIAELFEHGCYEPLLASGVSADHVIALRRRHGDATVVVAAARHPMALAPGGWPVGAVWNDTTIDTGCRRVTDVMTGAVHDGEQLELRAVFADLPVAVLLAR